MIANKACSAELAIIISYPRGASGIVNIYYCFIKNAPKILDKSNSSMASSSFAIVL